MREKLSVLCELGRKAVELGYADDNNVLVKCVDTLQADDAVSLEVESAVTVMKDWLTRSVRQFTPQLLDFVGSEELTLEMLRLPADRVTVLDIVNAPADLSMFDVTGSATQVIVIPDGIPVSVDGNAGSAAFEDFRVELITGREVTQCTEA